MDNYLASETSDVPEIPEVTDVSLDSEVVEVPDMTEQMDDATIHVGNENPEVESSPEGEPISLQIPRDHEPGGIEGRY